MVFSSLVFLTIFLPITILVYYLMPNRKLKNLSILLSSLFFYAWGEPVYIVLMIFSIFNDYFHAIYIDKFKKSNRLQAAKYLLVSSVVINLGLLFFFKYSNFLIDNLNYLFNMELGSLNLALPIGISFYTFQTMSYTIDVYRGKVNVQKSIISLGTYVALFPQLVAGPIVRYITIEDELENRKESFQLFAEGLRRFIIGLGKKVIIANQMAIIADTVFNSGTSDIGSLIILLGTLGYTFQIYFDFSGYSDMAIGLGKMFGFNFNENFNYPYISKSITDFWRRWHISLGTWFKDYIYIPLGGNRNGKLKWYRNIFIVWFITGLWHGAAYNYIIWGLYFGIILALEKIISPYTKKIPTLVKHFYALTLIIIGWIIFRIENISLLQTYIFNLLTLKPGNLFDYLVDNYAIIGALPYLPLAVIGSTPLIKKMIDHFNNKNTVTNLILDLYLILILIYSLVILVSGFYNPFIYFRF